MCGRYVIYTAEELVDLRDIVEEAQRRADAAGEQVGSAQAGNAQAHSSGAQLRLQFDNAQAQPQPDNATAPLFEQASILRVKTGEIFPTDIAPVLVSSAGASPGDCVFEAQPMLWGFPQLGGRKGVIFNTRLEQAAESPFWRDSLIRRRCVVPMSGFYAWQHGGPLDRQRYLFTRENEPLLYLAGIYQGAASAAPGDSPQSARMLELLHHRFSIMTTTPNASISDVHNRMPVVLRPSELEEWLFGDPQAFIDRNHINLLRQAT
jgi:putative SOS response-associated peptidase YedK